MHIEGRQGGGRGAFEFDLILQDNVLCLITKLFQKGRVVAVGVPYSGGNIVAIERAGGFP